MLRFGLIGCGTHANWAVIPAMQRASECCRLVAVADTNPENLAKIALPGVARFPSHEQMFASAKLDAVYVATLANTHASIAIAALNVGLHVICEKPMAASVEECVRMNEAASRAKRLLAVNFESRNNSEYRQVREWIQAGYLGRVEAIHIQNFWDGHKIYGDIGARRKRLMELTGGLDCGIHQSDLTRYLLGGRWKEIIARGRWLGEEISKPPHISILAELDNGVLLTLNASLGYGAQMKPKAYSASLTIVGNRGVINYFCDRIPGSTGAPTLVRLHSDELEATCPLEALGHDVIIPLVLKNFAGVVEGKPITPELATGEDGLQAQFFVSEANHQAIAHRVETG